HVVGVEAGTIDFDVISEFWQDSAHAQNLMAGEIGAIMGADEEKFMDRRVIRPAAAEEILIAGPPRGGERTERPRRGYLPAAGALAPAAFAAAARRWAEQIASSAGTGLDRVSLDLTRSFAGKTDATFFPYDAILSLWPAAGAPPTGLPGLPEGLCVAGR